MDPGPSGSATASGVVKKISLRSSDGKEFVVDVAVAKQSQTILHMIEDGCAEGSIPLQNVNSKTLAVVIDYCKKHVDGVAESSSDSVSEEGSPEEDLKTWDSEFVKVDRATLFDILLAANFLDIKGLLDLTCQAVADMIKNKTPEEVREIFNITNDFTPEEEEEVRRNNQWAFDN